MTVLTNVIAVEGVAARGEELQVAGVNHVTRDSVRITSSGVKQCKGSTPRWHYHGLVGVMVVLDWMNRNNERLTLQTLPGWARAPLSCMMFWLILRHLPAEPNFIYFQF